MQDLFPQLTPVFTIKNDSYILNPTYCSPQIWQKLTHHWNKCIFCSG